MHINKNPSIPNFPRLILELWKFFFAILEKVNDSLHKYFSTDEIVVIEHKTFFRFHFKNILKTFIKSGLIIVFVDGILTSRKLELSPFKIECRNPRTGKFSCLEYRCINFN